MSNPDPATPGPSPAYMPPPPMPPRLHPDDFPSDLAIASRAAGIIGLALMAATAVWMGQDGHWPACVGMAVFGVLFAVEMYLPGGAFRISRHPQFPTPPYLPYPPYVRYPDPKD